MRTGRSVAAVLGSIVVVSLLFTGCISNGDTGSQVGTNLTIMFFDAPAPFRAGNNSTWTKTGDSWSVSSTPNPSGETTWRFENVTSLSNCFDQLIEAAKLGQFSVKSENQTLGLIVVSIGEVHNLQYAGKAWQYFVNGTYANKACNMYAIGQGAEVAWKYIPNQAS